MVSMGPLDLYDEAGVATLIRLSEESFGGFDILWNNAGSLRFGGVEQSVADFEFTLRNEVTILFVMVRQAVEVFRRRGHGVIINTASVSATMGSGFVGNMPGLLAHSVSKAGVARLSVALAIELAHLNVRVNSISPGMLQTPATFPLVGTAQEPGPMRDAFLKCGLLKRLGEPDDVVKAAVYLASDEATFVTGVDLCVGGGASASGGVGKPDLARLGPLLASALR